MRRTHLHSKPGIMTLLLTSVISVSVATCSSEKNITASSRQSTESKAEPIGPINNMADAAMALSAAAGSIDKAKQQLQAIYAQRNTNEEMGLASDYSDITSMIGSSSSNLVNASTSVANADSALKAFKATSLTSTGKLPGCDDAANQAISAAFDISKSSGSADSAKAASEIALNKAIADQAAYQPQREARRGSFCKIFKLR